MFMTEFKLDLMDEAQEKYSDAFPYPHCIIDGMCPIESLDKILEEWPNTNHRSWQKIRNQKMIRNRNNRFATYPSSVKELFSYFGSPEVIKKLEELTGFQNLILDSEKFGAGMHHDFPGAYLTVHQDALFTGKLYRVVNLFLYLNKGWEKKNSGELVLWDALTNKPTICIPPLFNRIVIFTTDKDALHEVLPTNNSERKSLAFYYYIQNHPDPESHKSSLTWRA